MASYIWGGLPCLQDVLALKIKEGGGLALVVVFCMEVLRKQYNFVLRFDPTLPQSTIHGLSAW